jgi:hypothetical protein
VDLRRGSERGILADGGGGWKCAKHIVRINKEREEPAFMIKRSRGEDVDFGRPAV